jgi:hypothetical protein
MAFNRWREMEPIMQGKKTHEQQVRMYERKPDIPDARRRPPPPERAPVPDKAERQSEFTVSRGRLNQESDHNKHNDKGQSGHKPQEHSPSEEKH